MGRLPLYPDASGSQLTGSKTLGGAMLFQEGATYAVLVVAQGASGGATSDLLSTQFTAPTG